MDDVLAAVIQLYQARSNIKLTILTIVALKPIAFASLIMFEMSLLPLCLLTNSDLSFGQMVVSLERKISLNLKVHNIETAI